MFFKHPGMVKSYKEVFSPYLSQSYYGVAIPDCRPCSQTRLHSASFQILHQTYSFNIYQTWNRHKEYVMATPAPHSNFFEILCLLSGHLFSQFFNFFKSQSMHQIYLDFSSFPKPKLLFNLSLLWHYSSVGKVGKTVQFPMFSWF